jgi:hypothetical protein
MYRDKYNVKAPVKVHFYDLARTLNHTLSAIRRAQGKANPSDFYPGTPEWHSAVRVFAAELLKHGYISTSQSDTTGGRLRGYKND